MARPKSKTKKKTPSATRKRQVMGSALRKTIHDVMAATKKAEEAKAQAELKIFAAKLIAHIAKEAGIKARPPTSVKKAAIAAAKKKTQAAKLKAESAVAAALKRAEANQARAEQMAGR